MRFNRHQTVAIDRKGRDMRRREEKIKEIYQKRAQEAQVSNVKNTRPYTDLALVAHLEEVVQSTVSDVDQILDRPATEFEHNAALEAGVALQQYLDQLINSAFRRRNEAIELLDAYRKGFGQRARHISDTIIDLEAKEINEPATQVSAPAPKPSEMSAVGERPQIKIDSFDWRGDRSRGLGKTKDDFRPENCGQSDQWKEVARTSHPSRQA